MTVSSLDRPATSAGPRLREEQYRFHIEQTRHVAAHLCGRGLYQEMLVWETAEQTMFGEAELDFARIWRPIPKVVFSRTLNSVAGQRAAGHRRHRHRGQPTP